MIYKRSVKQGRKRCNQAFLEKSSQLNTEWATDAAGLHMGAKMSPFSQKGR